MGGGKSEGQKRLRLGRWSEVHRKGGGKKTKAKEKRAGLRGREES